MSGRKTAVDNSSKQRIAPRRWAVAVILAIGLTTLMTAGGGHWRARAATNWYVSPTGSDDNPGTPTSPFQSLKRAHEAASSGDTIFVYDGLYTDYDNLITIDKDITIQSLGNFAIINISERGDLEDPPLERPGFQDCTGSCGHD